MHACMLNCFSHVRLCANLWTVACEAPLSMGFSRREYWSGLLCPPPGDLPDAGIELHLLRLLHWQVGSLPLEGELISCYTFPLVRVCFADMNSFALPVVHYG